MLIRALRSSSGGGGGGAKVRARKKVEMRRATKKSNVCADKVPCDDLTIRDHVGVN